MDTNTMLSMVLLGLGIGVLMMCALVMAYIKAGSGDRFTPRKHKFVTEDQWQQVKKEVVHDCIKKSFTK